MHWDDYNNFIDPQQPELLEDYAPAAAPAGSGSSDGGASGIPARFLGLERYRRSQSRAEAPSDGEAALRKLAMERYLRRCSPASSVTPHTYPLHIFVCMSCCSWSKRGPHADVHCGGRSFACGFCQPCFCMQGGGEASCSRVNLSWPVFAAGSTTRPSAAC